MNRRRGQSGNRQERQTANELIFFGRTAGGSSKEKKKRSADIFQKLNIVKLTDIIGQCTYIA